MVLRGVLVSVYSGAATRMRPGTAPMPRKTKTRSRVPLLRRRRKTGAQGGRARTVEQLAAEQGVRPVHDPRELRGDFWPEAESTDDFLSWLREIRRDSGEGA
jgi:hypothetical protein